jgi:hypothetical protein
VQACASSAFSLVIIGTGISDSDKLKLCQHIRTTLPAAKLIDVHRGVPLLKADLDWEAGTDPSAFVTEIQRLMNRMTRAAAARS